MPNPVRRMRPSQAAARGRSAAASKAPSKVSAEEGRGFVSVEVKDRQGAYYQRDKEVHILREMFTEDDPPAHVRVSAGLTINMGNFESLRIDCSVSIPCKRDKLEEAHRVAADFVADRLAEEQNEWLGSGNEKTKGKGR